MSKKYVKSKGVYCPNCGKSRGVELLVEENYDHTKNYFIRCRHDAKLWKITNFGAYPSYDPVSLEDLEGC